MATVVQIDGACEVTGIGRKRIQRPPRELGQSESRDNADHE